MRQYTFYEMVGLVRMGCWNGGTVERIGYVGAAVPDAGVCGMGGLWLSPTVVLDRSECSPNGGSKAVFSFYDPYDGSVVGMSIETGISDWMVLYRVIEEISLHGNEAPVWFYKLYKKNIYRTERHYGTGHTSMRIGQIGKPQKSKIFRG